MRRTAILRVAKGTEDKYFGDGMIAFWGVRLTAPKHASMPAEPPGSVRKDSWN